MRSPVSNHYLDDQEDGKANTKVDFKGRTWVNRTVIGLFGGLLVHLLLAHMNQFRDRTWILFWVKI
jgi:hypothetical protein